MATLTLTLPPSRTAVIQLYARVGGAAVGSPIAMTEGSATIYTATVATGDYDVQLTGISTPDGARFPMRDGVAYPDTAWEVIDATITPTPITPTPITGLCHVMFSIVDGSGDPVEKASVYAQLEVNSTYDEGLIASTVVTAHTASNGQATLILIQNAQFTAGGRYTLRATDRKGLLLWSKRVRIPDASSANAADLVAV